MKEWNFTEEQATERWNENDSVNALLILNNLSTLGIEMISDY
jgi:hypothetical protein